MTNAKQKTGKDYDFMICGRKKSNSLYKPRKKDPQGKKTMKYYFAPNRLAKIRHITYNGGEMW